MVVLAAQRLLAENCFKFPGLVFQPMLPEILEGAILEQVEVQLVDSVDLGDVLGRDGIPEAEVATLAGVGALDIQLVVDSVIGK